MASFHNCPRAQASVEWAENFQCGEGPYFDKDRQLLFWVGIPDEKLMIYDPSTKQNKSFDMGEKTSFVVLTKSGDAALVGKPNGVALVEFVYGKDRNDIVDIKTTLIGPAETDLPNNRFNDGKCDPNGILWAGTMHVDCVTDKCGALYSFTYDENNKKLVATKHLDQIGISNGIAWNKKGDTMYYIDSFAEGIFAFDYIRNGLDVSIKNQRIIFKIPREWDSLPDGMAIDSDDKLWVAMYGLSAVVRIDPNEKDPDKQVLFRVDIPEACKITAAAFAGDDWTQMFITSACQRLDQETMNKYPKSGYLFHVNLKKYFDEIGGGVRGEPFVPFYTL